MNNPLSPFNLASPQLETGRVVVEASAGTGKTYSLTVLVVRHVAERSLTADQLLMVTFTNAATAELREKTREQAQETLQHLHNKNLEHPWMATMLATPEACATAIANLQQFLSHFDDTTITTIHGFCQIVLRRAGLHSPAPQNYVVQDNVDDIISQVITDLLNDPMSTNTRLLHGKLYPRSGDTPHPLTSSDVRSSLSKLREAVKRRMGNPKALMLPELAPSPFATKTDALKKRDSEITQQAETIAIYVSTVIAEVHRRSYAAGIITYDDMVRMVAETLEKNDEVAQNLARSIASQYSIVMVDEFQDTDASQWSIFSHIYEANPQEVTLVTVGDPKQAIYRFRGADVQVYIDAVRNVKQAHALDTNYRSDKKLLIALETLLQNNTFDTAGQVPFVRVNAAKKNEDGAVTSISVPPIPNVPGASLEIRYLANDPKLYAGTRINKDKSLTALNNDGSLVQRIFWRDMANHVVELLQHGSIPDKKSAIDGTTRAVTPNDIAILVNSHSDAETAVRYLHESLVPAVRFKTDSVFGSQAAMHWLMLLGALANPGKPQFVRAYALSWFGNVNEDELAQASDDTVATWQRECAENAELLRSRGVATLFLSFRNRAGFLQRVLGEDDGERNITDLDHLAEILASVPHFARNAGAGECYETLSELVNDSDSRNEQFQRRIEGDEVAVKVMTIHSSKGLQFPIVFLPTLIKKPPSIGSNPQMFSFTFPGESSSRRILDIASGHKGASNWVFSPTGDDDVFYETIYRNKREKKKVDLGRNLLAKNDVFFDSKRLLYVALTRAEHKVVLYWSATGENNGKGNIKVALAQTLSTHDAQLAGIPVEVEPLNALMAKIAGASQGTIAAIPLTATKAKPLEWTQSSSTPHTPASTAQYARTSAVRTYGFARWSYSTLSKTLTGDHYNKDSDNDIGGVTDESNDVPTLPPLVSSINIALDTAIATMPLYDIAGSNTFGNTVHEIFDSINPASLHLNEDVHDEVEHHFVNTHSTEQRAKIVGGIIASVHAPLGDPFAGHTLHSLGTTHRLSELEFNFHLPHNDVEAFPLSKIGALMLEHGDLDPYLTAYAQDIADNPSTVTVAGYMTGSIDAVFRVKSETSNPIYVVADYKTNRLHKPAKEHENPLTPYHPDNLVASMVKEGYILQALVYSVALHRYLQWRQPGYDPNIHLGGAAYLYVRGMTGHSTDEPTPRPYGVYHWRPTTDLVLALDALFTGKGN